MGVIPTPEISAYRIKIHNALDLMWITKKERNRVHKKLSKLLGYKYHTANIRNLKECSRVYRKVASMLTEEQRTFLGVLQ